ncbi:MAG: hypothetical protein EOP09_02895 [Proteobacteria bacterium]|nr:MAG: hypothetical protein EOP09_02895 [Pseudomonadota bacterium]
MSKKKGKFDLTGLVHDGLIKEGQKLFFVSDPSKVCVVTKQPNNEYKVVVGKETTTLHAFSVQCLGMDPPDHASKWFRDEKGTTVYEMWHANDEAYAA